MKIELLSCSVIYFGNFCSVATCNPPPPHRRRAAAATARCCERIPGDSRAIQRIQGIRAYPQIAHDHGSSISGSEAAHGNHRAQPANQRLHQAPLWRNTTSDRHCQGTNPPSRRPQSVRRGPSEGEEAPKKLLGMGSVNRILPSPPRHV